jgi:hypothetical protein
MQLDALTYMVVLALAPVLPGHSAEEDLPRYHEIADEISTTVEMAAEDQLPFVGPAAREASAIALATVARHESEFNEEIRQCRKKGDGGRSITIFQLYKGVAWDGRSEREICSEPTLAGMLALRSLKMFAHAPTPLGMFRGYASGNINYDWMPARRADRLFKKQVDVHSIKITKVKGRYKLWADFEDTEAPHFIPGNRGWLLNMYNANTVPYFSFME